ncbi:MAG: hypothetical protein WBA72_14430 [Ornithinimicrobium sp.]
MANLQRVQRLVERALDEFDSPGQTVAALLRQSTRIATLRNDHTNLVWLTLESMDALNTTGTVRALGPELLLHFNEEEKALLLREAMTGYFGRRAIADGKVSARSIEQIEEQIRSARTAASSIDTAQLHAQVLMSLGPLENVLVRVRARLHDFLIVTEHELEYGQLNAEIFERTRKSVDEQLRVIAPETLEKFTSAYRRLHEGDAEALSQALTSCRRILKATADAVYPATGATVTSADGNLRKMTDEAFINRLLQAVADAVGKHGNAKVVGTTLAALGPRLAALNELASKGVHSDVTADEVDTCVVQTYLMVGDVLRLVAGRSSVTLESTLPTAEFSPRPST